MHARSISMPIYVVGGLIVLPILLLLVTIPDIGQKLFSADGFMPHATCYMRNPQMVALHVSSDALIGLAYVAISTGLGYMVYRARKDIPFQWMFVAFGIFIIACGLTHLMEVWTVWNATYWLSGAVKLVTAVASIATAATLPFLFPKVFTLIETAKASETRRIELQKAHDELGRLYQRVKDADEIKSRFFANVSHELRTPLTLVLGATERLRQTNPGAVNRGDFDIIRRNALLLLRHVNDLLDASKLDEGKMELHYEEVDLARLVRLVASHFPSLASTRGITFAVHAPENLVGQADGEKVRRILFNLLSNAFKFVPDGGRIDLKLSEANGSARISVRDNGPGLPETFISRAFDRFQQADDGNTRQHGGTGLGLAIVREFTELHQGKACVENNPDKGAQFHVELPLVAPNGVTVQPQPAETEKDIQTVAAQSLAELRNHAQPSNATPGPAGAPSILVAEDNPEMREFIVEQLSSSFRVTTAQDGQEALEKLAADRYDLIVSDIMMPRVSGEQLLNEIRRRDHFADVPVMVLSARAEDDLRVALLRAGANDYMVKPFFPEELLARVSNLVALKKMRESLMDANKQLDEFNASVSHDLRAPLRSIRTFAAFVREDCADSLNPTALDYLRRISDNAERMSRLLEDLLAYSRLTRMELKLEPVNLHTLTEQIIASYDVQIKESNSKVMIEGTLPTVHGNSVALHQAIGNLIGNALKYVRPEARPEVRISATSGDGFICLTVRDNGIGIEPRFYERIFKPFERLHGTDQYVGTGLGLALVKKAVERLGGRVGVESSLGEGSRFWIELPSADANATDAS